MQRLTSRRLALVTLVVSILAVPAYCQERDQVAAPSPRDNGPWTPTRADGTDPELPTLFVVGDSTAATGGPTTRGWGAVLVDYFDTSRINVVNAAVGGRSFRTFTREGLWDRVVEQLKPGDFVIIELGHNDGGGVRRSRGRGDVPGVGDETETVQRQDGTSEVVHTYGWYTRKYIREARAKGATPVVSTTTVRNIWRNGKVERGMGQMREWAKRVAEEEEALFVDHSNITADVYEEMGEETVGRFFPRDHTHTNPEGAILNAETLIGGLRGLPKVPLSEFLNDKGKAIEPRSPKPHWRTFDPRSTDRPPRPAPQALAAPFGLDRRGRPLRFPPGVEPGMPHATFKKGLPTLWLVGDSTVKEGRDTGGNGGRWGWGHEIGRYFDLSRINVENQALGGTSSRSFITGGWWEQVLEMVRPGDFVIIQFGHNDGGIHSRRARIRARGTLPGTGDETVESIGSNGEPETAHTYGWYLGKYVADVRSAGATPIVCSLVPRNTWRGGKVVRGQDKSYVGWAREVATQKNVAFINLNHIICDRMDLMGEDFAATSLFRSDDHTHTTLLGAQINAMCVVSGIKALGEASGLADYLSPVADPVAPAGVDRVRVPD